MTQSTCDLIAHQRADQVFAWQHGIALSAQRFINDVWHVASLLPEAEFVLNACQDRYHFSVTFAAALVRKKVCLLPASHTPAMIASLRRQYSGLYCVTDHEQQPFDLPTLHLPQVGSFSTAPVLARYQIPQIDSTQLAAIVFTSGSTGEPTANLKQWGKLCINALSEAKRLQVTESYCLVGTVPAQHMYGFESTVLMAWRSGCSFYAGKPFYPADVRSALSSLTGPICLVTTPFHLKNLIEAQLTYPKIATLVCATSPLSQLLAVQAESFFCAPLIEIYGCTESGQLATRRSTQCQQWTMFDGALLKQQNDAHYAYGSYIDGEVLLSDHLSLHSPTEFTLQGRHEDMVNIAGKRSSLAYLNQQLLGIEGVNDGVFINPPSPTPDVIQRLILCVVAPTLDKLALLKALRLCVDAVFLPRDIYFVDALPRNNSTGKITAAALQNLIESLKNGRLIPEQDASDTAPSETQKYDTVWHVPTQHASLEGHFPGFPIVPGVLSIDCVLGVVLSHMRGQTIPPSSKFAFAHSVKAISSAKFLAPLFPGDLLGIQYQMVGNKLTINGFKNNLKALIIVVLLDIGEGQS